MPLYDVFLSHASADKSAVEHLAHKLREAGIEPFLDKWHLVPGDRWQEALEEAVAQSSSCAVFFGPVSKGGAWRNEETRLALVRSAQDASFRVIPVLLPGAKEEEVSGFLSLRTWFDFRAGLDDAGALARFIASIHGKAPDDGRGAEKPPLPYRCMAPPREPFIQRSEYAKVRDALLADGSARGTTVGITTAIHGAGGFGKTSLAVELCYDAQVRTQYPDGILWTTMGEEIDAAGRLSRVRDLIRWWTEKDPPAFETVSAASAHLRQELKNKELKDKNLKDKNLKDKELKDKELDGKRVLLVVDDVWRPEDVTPFEGLGPKAALLVTTRESRTLPVDAKQIHVDAMEIPEAVRLLGAGLPVEVEAELKTLATRLGEWPLLLKIVNRQLRELVQKNSLSPELALREVVEALDAEGLTAFDREDLESRGQAVVRTVGASLRRLSEEEVGRFEQLAIFPEDKDIPLRVLERLWGSGSFATKKLCGRLHDISLLLRFDRQAGTIRLHDVICAYLLKKGESHLPDWHRRLLDACRAANGRWSDLPREESYLWNHLIHHLIGAGQSDVCRALLLDFHYLRSKLSATEIKALLADYSAFEEEDEEVRLVRDALRLSARALASNPAELPGQLLGRLLDRQKVGIRSLLQESDSSDTSWLRPRIASLTRPGGALIRTIFHPGRAQALAVLPDGRVLSGSSDGKLRVWDVESGQTLQSLGGHSSWVRAVGVLGSRRVVSGSSDKTLRVWDVKSGRTLQSLEGHSSWVRAVGVLDSRWVVSGSSDGTLRVWDVESGRTLQSLEGHSSWVNAVGVLDSRRVISGSSDGTLRVWDVKSGRTLQSLEGHSSGVRAVGVLDSCRVVSGSEDGQLRVWDVESGRTLQSLEGHSSGVNAVGVLDSRRVISGSSDGTLWVWDVESGQTLQILEGHISGIRTVVVLDNGLVVSGSDGTLRVWDVDRGQTLQALEGRSNRVSAVAVLDGRRVVSGSSDGMLRVWDVESGQTLQSLRGHSDSVSAVAVLDSHRVVSGSRDRTLRVWDVESGQTLQSVKGNSSWIRAIAVLDSRRMVSGSDDRTLQVWDVESGQTLQRLEGHSDWVRAVAVLDSRRMVSGSDDWTLRVWDVESGQTLQRLEGHSSWVSAVAVLDSRRVVSGSDDGTLRVWDMESGEVECLFTLDAPVTAVTVLPESCTIVAGDSSGRVHFFDFVES